MKNETKENCMHQKRQDTSNACYQY